MKPISRILIFSMLHLCWLSSFGWAEMVKTESVLQTPSQIQTDRQRLLDFLNRKEVADELENYGISKIEAVSRINSLSDEEVTLIAGRLDELPAGGIVAEFVFILAIPFTVVYGILCYFTYGFFMGYLYRLRNPQSTKPQQIDAWVETTKTCFKPFGDTLRVIKGEKTQSMSVEESCGIAVESCP